MLFKIYKELLKLNNKEMKNLMKKSVKGLSRQLSKENLQMTNKHMKRCSSGKYKLKQQWDTTTHLSEFPKSKTLTPNAEDVEQQELSLLLGMQYGTAIFQDSLEVSYKTKYN